MKLVMKCFSHLSARPLQKLGPFALAGALCLGWLALRPAPISTAGVPKVFAGAKQQKIQATAPARLEQRQEQARQIRPENFDLGRYPITNKNEDHWRNILWTTAVVEPQETFVAEAIERILAMTSQPGLSNSQQRTIDMAAKVGTQLYLSNRSFYAGIEQQFLQTIDRSPDPEWVAVAVSSLAKAGLPLEQLQGVAQRVKARFPKWSNNLFLKTTLKEVAQSISPSSPPPLRDLLNWTIAPKQLHLYVLCPPDRDVLCQAVLKDRQGEFVRHQDGQLWSVPLLLRSIHGLDWNFVRGQTPQGIYRIEGTVPQPDDQFFRAYGQFPLVNLFVPFEPGAKQFLPGKSGTFNGSLQTYQNLLPPSWRDSWSMQQSFWAGKIGRGLFRIHGTGESPDFFSGKDKRPDTYNWNPTIGCLSALELYSEKGQLLQADMPKILDALTMVGGKKFAGYMMVAEIPNSSGQPISLAQIEAAISGNKSLSKGKKPPSEAKRATNVSQAPAPLRLALRPTPATPISPTNASSVKVVDSVPLTTEKKQVEENRVDSEPVTPTDITPEVRPLPMAY